MAPFKFKWTPDLDKAFRENKAEIVRLVKNGAKMFDMFEYQLLPDKHGLDSPTANLCMYCAVFNLLQRWLSASSGP